MPFGFFKKKGEVTKPSGTHYHEVIVREVIKETSDSVSLVFEPIPVLMNYKAGQFLTLLFNIHGNEVRRAYSLCSSPVTDVYPAVAVKRVEKGLVSNYIVDHVKVGDRIRIMDPAGNFTVDFGSDTVRHLVLFAGGSGITPMISLLKTLLAVEKESYCTLVYSNRNESSIIFRNTIDGLLKSNAKRLKVHYLLDDAPTDWSGYSGFLNESILSAIFDQFPSVPESAISYMMCGPEAMMKNVEQLLTSRGVPSELIRHESFNQSNSLKKTELDSTDSVRQVSHEVLIKYDGQQYRILVHPDKTILETALANGIDLPYSCQSGLCTACRGKAISGKVKLDEEDGLSKSELEEGYVLTCVGHPLSDDVVIEIG